MMSDHLSVMKQQQKQQRQRQLHPMIGVPDAIRIVLQEAGRQFIHQQQQRINDQRDTSHSNVEEISLLPADSTVDSGWQQLQYRILQEDVRMRPPGYPPYAASMVDGYAIHVREGDGDRERERSSDDDIAVVPIEKDGTKYTHVVKEKIYAGDPRRPSTDPIIEPIVEKQSTFVAEIDDDSDDDDDDIQSTTSSRLEFKEDDPHEVAVSNLPIAYYVTTGAMIPTGCNMVVPIEDVIVHHCGGSTTNSTTGTLLHILASAISSVPKHCWIRQPGSDVSSESLLLPKDTVLDPIAIALLYQSGSSSIKVRRKVSIGILSTGSELYDTRPTATTTDKIGNDNNNNNNDGSSIIHHDWWKYSQTNRPGTIPDINRPLLLSLFTSSLHHVYRCNTNVVDLGIIRDDSCIDHIAHQFRVAVEQCDIVISTGGISVGETDFIENVIMNRMLPTSHNVALHFGRLHMKPGKPTTFFTIPRRNDDMYQKCLWFAMPGNPVSAYVCTHLLVIPTLHLLIHGIPPDSMDRMIDDTTITMKQVVPFLCVHNELDTVTLSHDIKLDPERPEYHRVVFVNSNYVPSKNVYVRSTGVQQSSRLLSLQNSDGVIVLPQATKDNPIAKAGTTYTLLLLFNHDTILSKPVQESKHLLHNVVSTRSLLSDVSSHSVLPIETAALPILTNRESTVITESIPEQRVALSFESPTEKATHPTKPLLYVGIVQISPDRVLGVLPDVNESDNDLNHSLSKPNNTLYDDKNIEIISKRVERALSGSKSGPVQVVSNMVYTGAVDQIHRHLLNEVAPKDSKKDTVDILVIVGASSSHQEANGFYSSSYHRYMQVVHVLRNCLQKQAFSMSIYAKENAKKQDSFVGTIFEIVIGYMYTIDMNEQDGEREAVVQTNASRKQRNAKIDSAATHDTGNEIKNTTKNGCIVVLVPEKCLDSCLRSIRGLLKHSLQVAR